MTGRMGTFASTTEHKMSEPGAPAAYRGYRLQALYTLKRVLASADSESPVFHLEGLEDLDIRGLDGQLMETVQVKSYSNLALSDLSPSESGSFFHRAAKLAQDAKPPVIQLVNFGEVGPELRQAWAGIEPHRTRVTNKLLECGLEISDIEAILAQVKLVELDEDVARDQVYSTLRQSPIGADPSSAFDLLNFWLYRAAERRATIRQADLTEKIGSIGRFLADRVTYHSEWFTTITPLVDRDIPDDQQSQLREEFYAGVATRYEHILAELDFRRERKLAEITEKFGKKSVVILYGVSGQGKTALALRYLHETYPNTWRFTIELIENRQHALRIATALAGYASALQVPMAIYVDVSPRDTAWPELVKRLAHFPQFQILITIREEDFRRANIPGSEFDYEAMELVFDETEARLIYVRALASGQARDFLDFDEAWDKFGGDGPLMEFVYLLTQTTTLRERLHGQVQRIRDEVRLGAHPDELALLRLISVASAYEARLHVPALVDSLRLPDPYYTMKLFEKEYLIRLTSGGLYVEGLHPIRSSILVDLLTGPGDMPWLEVATSALALMAEDDLEIFTLHALLNRPAEREHLLSAVQELEPTSWVGLASILRVLLWSGVHAYVESNIEVIEQAHEVFGQGWSFILDLDFVGISESKLDNWWTRLGGLIPPERQAELQEIRARQTPKTLALKTAGDWLSRQQGKPTSPSSIADWSGGAEVCFWGGCLGSAPHIDQWISNADLRRAIDEIDLSLLADLSLGLHTCDPQRQAQWIQDSLPALQSRLAQELRVLSLEKKDGTLITHFLPSTLGLGAQEERSGTTVGRHSSDPFHDEAMDRIRLVRGIFPDYEAYGSQGHGYRLGDLESPFDESTTKTGIPVSLLPPAWAARVNSIAHGLGHTRFRPNTWSDYLEQVLGLRELVLACLDELKRGLVKYLQRSKAIDVREYLDLDAWLRCHALTNAPPPLPKAAVDPWGMAHEGTSTQFLRNPVQQAYFPKAIALQKYGSYLDAQREYTSSLSAFLQQALNVMVTNLHIGKLPLYSAQRKALLEALHQEGIKTDLAFLSTYNLAAAKLQLPAYQSEFKALFSHLVEEEKLSALETREKGLISLVWQLWFFYANEPAQEWATPLRQIPARVKLKRGKLEDKIQQAVDNVTTGDISFRVLTLESDWDTEPTLWLRMDLEDPTQLFIKAEELILTLRKAIGHIDFKDLAYRIIEENWKCIAVVPVVRGRMLDQTAWKLYTLSTILTEKDIGENVWLYVPQLIPAENWDELELPVWDDEDITLGNQLNVSVTELSLFVAQIADLGNLPDLSEAGEDLIGAYIEKQATQVNQRLQAVYDLVAAMLMRNNELPTAAQKEREGLKQAVEGLIEMDRLVRPSDHGDAQQVLGIDAIVEYAHRLAQARPLAEDIRLYWLADVLDHIK